MVLLDLRLVGIFISTVMASLLMTEMSIEKVEDSRPSRSSCLEHTVAQYSYIANSREKSNGSMALWPPGLG